MSNYISEADFCKILELMRQVGCFIAGLQGQVEREEKPDGSPVTIADKLAGQMIVEALSRITPHIPVICEESPEAENRLAAQSRLRWITDPLDGTRTFLDGYDGYGCHLGLVDGDIPVMGFAYFPSREKPDVLYFTALDGKSYRQEDGQPPEEIQVTSPAANQRLTAASGWSDKITAIGAETVNNISAVGGGILCVTAAGNADIGWMNKIFCHWDTAAAQAIICAAGGAVVEIATGKPVRYAQETFIVPPMAGGKLETLKRLGLADSQQTLKPPVTATKASPKKAAIKSP